MNDEKTNQDEEKWCLVGDEHNHPEYFVPGGRSLIAICPNGVQETQELFVLHEDEMHALQAGLKLVHEFVQDVSRRYDELTADAVTTLANLSSIYSLVTWPSPHRRWSPPLKDNADEEVEG